MAMEDLPVWYMALNSVKGMGRKTICKAINPLMDVSNTDEAYLFVQELAEQYKRIKPPARDEFDTAVKRARDILTQQEKDGIVPIVMGSNRYPNTLYALDDPPVVLYARGNVDALMQKGIAVVGTREVSPYGRTMGEHIGKFVADHGFTDVSGLAEGCDTAGHRGCLQAGGVTIAIVATPLNQVYPKSNESLAKEILAHNGCFISEYPYGAQTSRYSFVERDRLQCGLANGVIVVETGEKGGTMHAVNGALALEKPVGCFNYKDDHYERHVSARGNRMLINSGKAVALYSAESMLAFLRSCDESAGAGGQGMYQSSLF